MDCPEDYVRAHDLQKRDVRYVIEEFSEEISQMNGNIVDIGCGPGWVTKHLLLPKLPRNASVTGVDISKKMLDHFKSYIQDNSRINCLQLDIDTKLLPKDLVENFDNAVSFFCLHWSQHIRVSFRNIFDMIKPGGKVLLIFVANHSCFESYLKFSEHPQYQPYTLDAKKFIPHLHNSSNPRKDLKNICEEVGFQVVHCSCRERVFIHESTDDFKDMMLAVNPFLPRMPEDLKKKFEKDFVEDLLSNKIIFQENNLNSNEITKVVDTYNVFITYLKKPL